MLTTFAKLPLLLVIPLFPLTLAACATTTASSGRSERALCDAFRPIHWAAGDTDQTVREAKAHNAVGVKICGWKP